MGIIHSCLFVILISQKEIQIQRGGKGLVELVCQKRNGQRLSIEGGNSASETGLAFFILTTSKRIEL